MFGVNGGFDIVIANPPYIDSETMTKTMLETRLQLKKMYSTAKGNWDMYIVFIEKGVKLLKHKGTLSYIIPNKLIGAKYSSALRRELKQYNITEIRDYGDVKVFEASVYPCIITLNKKDGDTAVNFTKMIDLTKICQVNKIEHHIFNSDLFWDKYFVSQDKLNVINKISKNEKLSYYFPQIHGSATVGEAYLIKEYIINHSGNTNCQYKKFINTGTIDPYVSLWEQKKTQYIKSAYIQPVLSHNDIIKVSNRRYVQSNSIKVIIAGMSLRIEALYDEGEYLAGKSTSIIIGDMIEMKYITALLNSKLINYWFRITYNSLTMQGGYFNIGVNELSSIPCIISTNMQVFTKYVDKIIAIKKLNYLEDTSALEAKIDQMVYALYNLTEEEIKIIENK